MTQTSISRRFSKLAWEIKLVLGCIAVFAVFESCWIVSKHWTVEQQACASWRDETHLDHSFTEETGVQLYATPVEPSAGILPLSLPAAPVVSVDASREPTLDIVEFEDAPISSPRLSDIRLAEQYVEPPVLAVMPGFTSPSYEQQTPIVTQSNRLNDSKLPSIRVPGRFRVKGAVAVSPNQASSLDQTQMAAPESTISLPPTSADDVDWNDFPQTQFEDQMPNIEVARPASNRSTINSNNIDLIRPETSYLEIAESKRSRIIGPEPSGDLPMIKFTPVAQEASLPQTMIVNGPSVDEESGMIENPFVK